MRRLAAHVKRRIGSLLTAGFWWCFDCLAVCDREEGEQGQPAHCAACGSHRIKWNKPELEEQTHAT